MSPSLRGIKGEAVPLAEGDTGGGCLPVRRTHNVLAEGGLTEGDTGGGDSSRPWRLSTAVVARTSVSTTEHHDPLRSVACQQRNASPLRKGDKVTNVGWTSIQLPNTMLPCVPLHVGNGTRPH
jgi:hypothetical protein